MMRALKYTASICLLFWSLGVLQAQAPSKFYMRFGGAGYDYGYDVKQTLDKGYIIAGSTSSFGQGNTDAYLVKLDSMGIKQWEQAYGNYNNEEARSVLQLADSSYVIAGFTNSTGFGGYDVYMVKTDKYGNLQWQKTFGGTDWDFAYSLRLTSDGGYVLAGTTYSTGRGAADGYIIKTDASGMVQWTKTYGGAADDEFKCVIQTSDGGYALAGYTKSYADANGDVWLFKLDAAGDSTWCQFQGGAQQDYAEDVIVNASGEYYLAGATASFGSGALDAYALKLTSTGSLIWHQEDGHPSTNESFHNVVFPLFNLTYSAYSETDNLPAFGIHPKIMILSHSSYYFNATGYGDVTADEIFKLITTTDKGFAAVGYTYGFNAEVVDVFFIKTDSTLLGSPNVTGIKEEQAKEPALYTYPNPANDVLHVSVITNQKPEIKLYDLYGREITSVPMDVSNPADIRIDTRTLSSGVYFLKVFSQTRRIIVSH